MNRVGHYIGCAAVLLALILSIGYIIWTVTDIMAHL
jgi:hypothetical protein